MKDGILSVDREGTITEIDSSPRIDSMSGVEFHSGILIPGMVNAHCHLELSYLRGEIAPGGGFSRFASEIGKKRNLFSEEQKLEAIAYQDSKMWCDGVQAVGDVCNSDTTFQTKAQSKIRYHSFAELYGLGATSLAAVEPLLDSACRHGISCTVTPHSTYSLNEEAFRLAVGGAQNSPLSIHFMESPSEKELYAHRGPMLEWYRKMGFRTDFEHYRSPALRIAANVSGNRDLLLIHNTVVERPEAQELQSVYGNRLTWVLCPRSNDYISGLRPPVEMLRMMACRIAVGTDSLASNPSLSIIDELRTLSCVPLHERLLWATRSGAEALGMDGEIGSFEVGKRPGVVLLEGADTQAMALTGKTTTRRLI